MLSSNMNVAGSSPDISGRLIGLPALSQFYSRQNNRKTTPMLANEAPGSVGLIAWRVRFSHHKVRRVLKWPQSVESKLARNKRANKGRPTSTSIFCFLNDPALRGTNTVRVLGDAADACRAKHQGLTNLKGRVATFWVGKNEEETVAVAPLKPAFFVPLVDAFTTSLTGLHVRLQNEANRTYPSHLPDICYRSPTPPIKITPQGIQNAGASAQGKPGPGPLEQTAEDVAISALAREAGAQAEMISRLQETSWRRDGDTGRLIVVARSPWVRDQLLGMRQTPLVSVARLLGLEGVEIVLEAGQ